MTVAHFLYIPAMLGVGILIGYLLRGRVDTIRREEPAKPLSEREAAARARERRG